MKAKKITLVSLIVAVMMAFAMFALSLSFSTKAYAEPENIVVGGQTVDISSFKTYAKAQIRLDENKGIRFISGINAEVFNTLNTISKSNDMVDVSFGTIITYKSRANAVSDFTKEELDKMSVAQGTAYVDAQAKVFLNDPIFNAEDKEFTAVMNVAERNFDKELVARAYMQVVDNGVTTNYYADIEDYSKSTSGVAKTLIEDFTNKVGSTKELRGLAEYAKNVDAFSMKEGFVEGAPISATKDSTLTKVEIGGRQGVYQLTQVANANQWANRIDPAFTSPATEWVDETTTVDHQKAYERQNVLGIKYVAFDFYYNGNFDVQYPTAARLHKAVKMRYGTVEGNETDWKDHLGVYNADGLFTTVLTKGNWYTVIVDISCNIGLGYNSAISTTIVPIGNNVTCYFDNVRLYKTDAFMKDYLSYIQKTNDELIIAKDGGGAVLETTTFAGRDNVTHIVNNSQQAGYTKVTTFALKETNNHGSSPSTVVNNMAALGVKYVTIDICRNTDSALSLYAYGANNGYLSMTLDNKTGAINYKNDCISLYDASGNKATVMQANVWYTAVIEWQAISSQWTAVALEANWINVAVDNIRYYLNDSYIKDLGIQQA